MNTGILIVDDDPVIRDGIRALVEEHAPADISVFEACNGIEAIERVCTETVDVIFADVKMPLCDGIEMQRRLNELNYRGQVVVVSGYDEFDLVRETMRNGASDYLLKPLERSEIVPILVDCCGEALRRRAGGTFHSNVGTRTALEELLTQRVLLQRIIIGDPVDPHVARFLKGNGIGSGCAVTVCVSTRTQQAVFDENDNATMLIEVGKALGTVLDGVVSTVQGLYHHRWTILIFHYWDHPPFAPVENAESIVLAGQRFACSRPVEDLSQVPAAFSACHRIISRAFYRSLALEPPTHATRPRCAQAPFSLALPLIRPIPRIVEAVVQSIRRLDKDAVGITVGELFDAFAAQFTPIPTVGNTLEEIVYRALQLNPALIPVVGACKLTDNDIGVVIEESWSASVLRNRYTQAIETYIDRIIAPQQHKEGFVLRKAKQIIETEYADNITLTALSRRLHVHPNHLSSVFRHEGETSFSQYLRAVRIREAIALMQHTDLKIYQIGEQTGFADNTHFSRSFKAETGLSPSQYRRRFPS